MNAPAHGEARGFASTSVALLVAVLAFWSGVAACAQSHRDAGSDAPAVAVSTVPVLDVTRIMKPEDLNTGWLVQAGDNPAWARADFDDSRWIPFDPAKNLRSYFPKSRPSVVWYRLHLKVSPEQKDLALRVSHLATAYEVDGNGERLMGQGRITPFTAYTFDAPVVSRIPARMLADGSLVIAARVYISPWEWSQGGGLTAGNLTLGEESTLRKQDWLMVIGHNALDWLDLLMGLAVGVVALVLFAAQRSQKAYLWIAALGLVGLVAGIEPAVAVFRNVPYFWAAVGHLPLLFTPYILTSLYFAFLGKRKGWGWRVFLVAAGCLNYCAAVQVYAGGVPVVVQILMNLPFILLLAVMIPVLLMRHWRRGNREAGILLIPALLFSLYIYLQVALGLLYQFSPWSDAAQRGLTLINQFPVGPVTVSFNIVSDMLSTIALALIILLRSAHASRKQAILESELAAAQQVQQVLLPEETEAVPGFAVETVYQPAQQVGGDFFQVLPSGDGGLLVVVGDVAGKGLTAAMLVSVLVGAIRGATEYTSDPVELLCSLNERLVGRGGGSFSTALVALIRADGEVVIANAGHLSPYLDGREVALPGALPLGVISGAEYETSRFSLAPGSRLTFYSDGVVEAQNARGEMFGFDRAMEMSTHPAAAIVEAVRQFGQQDDITVVTVARPAVIASAA